VSELNLVCVVRPIRLWFFTERLGNPLLA